MVIKQIGPTCGIYALINGLLYNIDSTKTNNTDWVVENNKIIVAPAFEKTIHKLVLKLLIKNKKNVNNLEINTIDKSTYIGEFFNTQTLVNFINDTKNQTSIKDMLGLTEKNNFTATIVDIKEIREIKTFSSINTEAPDDNFFYLVDIFSNRQSIIQCKSAVSHWICVNKDITFINTNKPTSKKLNIDKKIKEHTDLEGKFFSWKKYNYYRKFCCNNEEKKKLHIFFKKRAKAINVSFKDENSTINYSTGKVIKITIN